MDDPKPRFTVAWINIACAIFSSIGAFIFGFDSGMSICIWLMSLHLCLSHKIKTRNLQYYNRACELQHLHVQQYDWKCNLNRYVADV